MSHPEEELLFHIKAARLPMPEREKEFYPPRKWRADFAWEIPAKLIVEIDGGMHVNGGGRHNRADGFEKDCEKLAMAAVLGYRVMRFTPRQVTSGMALSMIEAILKPQL